MRIKIGAVLAAVTLITSALCVVTAEPAAAVHSARKVVGDGAVRNMWGHPVDIRCDYGSSKQYRLYEYGNRSSSAANSPPYWHSDSYCLSDTDQFKASSAYRCMHYRGPGATDGWYKLKPGVWRKVSDLATVSVHEWGSKCAGKPYFTKT